jgi:hypothetical protein
MIATQPLAPSEQVPGKKLLLAIGAAILTAALVGTASYYLLRSMIGNRTSVAAQIVTLVVYLTLTLTLCVFFRPPVNFPISLRFTGMKHAVAAIGIWAATVVAIVLLYYCLGSIFGSVPSVTRQIVAIATDAKRLQGQPAAAWYIAIIRGCLMVPIFEEVFFRGLLLSWLKKHLEEDLAVVVMAALFALEHGSFIVGPYVFLFAISAGYVRLRTGSTFNPIIMHSLNNIMLLLIGLRVFNAH